MKSITLALCLVGCGSTANNYYGHQFQSHEPSDAGIQVLANETAPIQNAIDAQSLSCAAVSGSWYVRFSPVVSPIVPASICGQYELPTQYISTVEDTLPFMNTEATLSSVSGSTCIYQSDQRTVWARFRPWSYDSGFEQFVWDGQIKFQRITGGLTVAVVNGRPLVEQFFHAEVGLTNITIGECAIQVVFTKDEQ